jgi:hypothetical protein
VAPFILDAPHNSFFYQICILIVKDQIHTNSNKMYSIVEGEAFVLFR